MSPETNSHPLYNSLDNFFKRYLNIIEAQTNSLPVTEYDSDWPSICQQGEPFLSEEMMHSIYWIPIIRNHNNDLSGLERALEIELHPDIKIFFTHYWSEQIDAIFQNGNLSLMFVWNEDDM